MRVIQCKEKATKETRDLTYDEMIRQEGVYKPLGVYVENHRIIVLRHKTNSEATGILWFNGTLLEPANPDTWKTSYIFVKTNEEVCFSLV